MNNLYMVIDAKTLRPVKDMFGDARILTTRKEARAFKKLVKVAGLTQNTPVIVRYEAATIVR
jgi:hypothetical protein